MSLKALFKEWEPLRVLIGHPDYEPRSTSYEEQSAPKICMEDPLASHPDLKIRFQSFETSSSEAQASDRLLDLFRSC
jgi:hypothetical protein